MGRRQCLGGRIGRREKDTGRLNPNEGAFLQTESACVSPADGLLSVQSWGVGAESFPCAQGGLLFITYFTSLSPLSLGLCYTLFCLLLFCASLCISLLLTFFAYKTQRFFFFSFMEGGGHFSLYGLFCVVSGTSCKAGCDRRRMLSRAVPACSVAVPP